jgi:arginase family enzyme
MATHNDNQNKVALISAELNHGQGKIGTEFGPDQIKMPYLFENMENLGYKAFDYKTIGDIEVEESEEVQYLKNKHLFSISKTTNLVNL